MKKLFLMIPTIMLLGCAKKNAPVAETPSAEPVPVHVVQPMSSRPVSAVLKASAFKMTGDYSNNVAVTLNPDGSLAYYPAPTDITPNSRPVELGDGWWLNRQGLSPNSVFTRYTFEEYAKLSSVPSQEEIKKAIIPGARVEEMKVLPFPAAEAMKHLPEIKKMLK